MIQPIDHSARDHGPFHLSNSADAITQARWLQGWVKGYAEDMALAQVAGVDLQAPSGEAAVLFACIDRGARLGIPRETAIAAARAAWRKALEAVRDSGEDIRRAVWPLAKMRAPGAEIMAAAMRALDRKSVFVPTPVLINIVRKIAHAAAGGYPNARRK